MSWTFRGTDQFATYSIFDGSGFIPDADTTCPKKLLFAIGYTYWASVSSQLRSVFQELHLNFQDGCQGNH